MPTAATATPAGQPTARAPTVRSTSPFSLTPSNRSVDMPGIGRNPNDREDHPDDEGHPDTRPYFCIPYWSAPVAGVGPPPGARAHQPLPAAVCSYLCGGIHAGAFTPGQRLDVTVDVRNSGGGNSASIATVVIYWA